MKTLFHALAASLSISCFGIALAGFSGCDHGGQGQSGAGDLGNRVRVAKLERDGMKQEIEDLQAQLADEPSTASKSDLAAVEDELKTVRAANSVIQEEIRAYKKKFPLPERAVKP